MNQTEEGSSSSASCSKQGAIGSPCKPRNQGMKVATSPSVALQQPSQLIAIDKPHLHQIIQSTFEAS